MVFQIWKKGNYRWKSCSCQCVSVCRYVALSSFADDGIPLKEKSNMSPQVEETPTLYRNNLIVHQTFVFTRQNGIRGMLNQSFDWFKCVSREGPAVWDLPTSWNENKVSGSLTGHMTAPYIASQYGLLIKWTCNLCFWVLLQKDAFQH